ncbi:MAG: helix-turn-helix domain-containing protein [Spirosomataceae bacterium]
MTNVELSTEDKILQAAVKVFLRDSYDGSRMQDIADLAGINKALLHYYFRSKDKLFERVFEEKIQVFFLKCRK